MVWWHKPDYFRDKDNTNCLFNTALGGVAVIADKEMVTTPYKW